MEALVAVGFAANILQFVDCIRNVLNVGDQIRRNGMKESTMDLDQTAKVMERQLIRLKSQQGASTGLDEADKALNDLADECMAVVKELIAFIAEFKIDRATIPQLQELPSKKRPKHESELELERQISATETQMEALSAAIQSRKAREKRREADRIKREKKKREEQKARLAEEKKVRAKERKDMVSRLKTLINRDVKAIDEVDLNRVIEMRMDQKAELEELILARHRTEEVRGHECKTKTAKIVRAPENVVGSRPRSPDHADAEPIQKSSAAPVPIQEKTSRNEDEVQLDKLITRRSQQTDDLKRLEKKLDFQREEERDRIRKANEEAKKRSDFRQKAKSLSKAIKLEWNTPKIEALLRRLENVRNLLYSEVMQNIQKSVQTINKGTDQSHDMLAELSRLQHAHHEQTLKITGSNHSSVEGLIKAQDAQIATMEDDARKHHDAALQAINSFIEILQRRLPFPAIPEVLTRVDPSLRSAALTGFEAIENAVLTELFFRKMEDRGTQVQEAYRNTCSWVFKDPTEHQKPWSNFRTWLETGAGCYWIGGKPGCGKSTLMKFLRSDTRTAKALKEWTGSDTLVTASYFFWMAGTALQKNQEGLLRSLLHTIFTQRRDLIARCFPDQYNAMMSKVFAANSSPDIFFSCDNPGCSSWFEKPRQLEEHQKHQHRNSAHNVQHNADNCRNLTVIELKRAFNTLAKENMNGFKICLFIDGLDEYVGNQVDMVNLFKDVTIRCPAIKAVVSSRLEPVFLEAFQDTPQLQLEHLTAGDIDHYVRANLLVHTKMQGSTEIGEKLVSSIVAKASGVFLWVFLVVRSLIDGLTDGDYPEDLERIINTYPDELRDLYEHMFARMKLTHRAEAFKLFQAILHAQEIESKLPSALRLSYTDREQPSGALPPIKTLDYEELQMRLSGFERRLKSRCCGLFEVQHFERSSTGQTVHIKEGRIAYLHRTVKEFLNEPGFRQILERETSGIKSEIHKRLAASVLYTFKSWKSANLGGQVEWKEFAEDIRAFFIHCHLHESMTAANTSDFIREIDKILTQFWQARARETRSRAFGTALGNYDRPWAESILHELRLKSTQGPEVDPLLSLAARYGLSTYVCERFETLTKFQVDFVNVGGRDIVLQLASWAMHDSSLNAVFPTIVAKALDLGLKVNNKRTGPSTAWVTTIWQDLLHSHSHFFLDDNPPSADILNNLPSLDEDRVSMSQGDRFTVWSKIVELFILRGAHLDVSFKAFKGATKGRTARETINEVLAAPSIYQGLYSDELLLVNQRKSRLEGLLARNPAPINDGSLEQSKGTLKLNHKPQRPRRFSPEKGQDRQNTLSPMSSPRCSNSRSRSSTHCSEEPRDAVKGPNPTPVATIEGHCRQCKTIKELRGLGYEHADIMEALEKANADYNVPTLASWIRAQALTPPKTLPGASIPGNLNALYGQTHARKSAESKWSDVAKKQSAQPKQGRMPPGAEFVIKEKKAKRSKGKSKALSETVLLEGRGLNAGILDLGGGTFTWSLDSTHQSRTNVSLTADEAAQLEQLLRSFKK